MALIDDVALIDDMAAFDWTNDVALTACVDRKTCVQDIHIHGMTTLMMCSIQSELVKWRNPKCPNCLNLMAMIYSLYL